MLRRDSVSSAMSDTRFPLHVRLIGVMQREKSKMFMALVLWSDDSEMMVFRSLRDFKSLHKQLKKKFTVANALHKQQRVIPRFGVNKISFHMRDLNQCVDELRRLEKYWTSLMQCDAAVTHSTEVLHFLRPNQRDLEPEFTQNSVLILQSDNIMGGTDMAKKHLSFGNVTQPFVSKTYRCVSSYETKDTKNKPFKVAENERLDVLIKDPAGWWLVENEDKRLAWFPAPYLELCEEEDDEDKFDSTSSELSLYCATRGYTSNTEDELSLSVGAVVEVIQTSDNGWWLVRYNRKAGYVPSMYLKPYMCPMFGLQTLQKKHHSSTINLSTSSIIHRSSSLEMLSDRDPEQHEESGSLRSNFSNDGTVFSYGSSDCDSISPSLYSSERDEGVRRLDKDASDSGISSGQSTPTARPIKEATPPRVPPRPRRQEIFSRCTTYTRKAALAASEHLFGHRSVMDCLHN